MKKSIAVFLAVINCGAVMVACGSTSSDGNSPATGGAGKSSSAGAGGAASAGAGGARSTGGGGNSSAGTGGSSNADSSGNSSAGSGGNSTAGSAGNASGGSSGGSEGAELSFTCGKLATCCVMLGGASEGACQGTADANDDDACSTQLNTYGAACLINSSCNMSASGTCQELPIFPYYAMQAKSDCMQAGGVPVTSCPTADLIGCCTYPVAGGACYYSNATAPTTQSACTQNGGTWSTTPE